MVFRRIVVNLEVLGNNSYALWIQTYHIYGLPEHGWTDI